MALRGNRAIKLAIGVIAATNQRLDRAIGVERDKGALVNAKGRAFAIERVVKGGFRERLQASVERCRDGNILIDRADRIVERIHHEIGSVVDRASVLVPDGLRGMSRGERGHRIGDKAFLTHGLDNLACTLGGTGRVAIGRQPSRRLHKPREDGCFGQRHIAGAVTKIFLRCRFDTIGAGAEIDAVKIQFQNLIFRIFMLEPEREDRLLDFA